LFFHSRRSESAANTSCSSEGRCFLLGMFINGRKHTGEACTRTFFLDIPLQHYEKVRLFLSPPARQSEHPGISGLDAGAAPDEQRSSSAIAFGLAAGVLLMFLSCSLPLGFSGGGCIRVYLMASSSFPILARPLAKGLLLSQWLGWWCGRNGEASACSCAVLWRGFLV